MVVEKLQSHELFALLTPKEVERLSSASGVVKLKRVIKSTGRVFQRVTSLYFLRGGWN